MLPFFLVFSLSNFALLMTPPMMLVTYVFICEAGLDRQRKTCSTLKVCLFLYFLAFPCYIFPERVAVFMHPHTLLSCATSQANNFCVDA